MEVYPQKMDGTLHIMRVVAGYTSIQRKIIAVIL